MLCKPFFLFFKYIYFSYLVDGSSETIIGKFGEAELPLFNILSSNGQMSIPILSDSLKPGWSLNSAPLLNVSIDAPETSRNGTILQFHGSNLNPNNGFLTAPYFTLSLLPNDERETKAVCSAIAREGR